MMLVSFWVMMLLLWLIAALILGHDDDDDYDVSLVVDVALVIDNVVVVDVHFLRCGRLHHIRISLSLGRNNLPRR